MRARVALALLLVAGALVGAFFVGRGSAPAPEPKKGSFDAGYLSGREDAFAGFDGGWRYRAPYIVTLRKGPTGVTYRFARRWPMQPGLEYRACGSGVCTRKAP